MCNGHDWCPRIPSYPGIVPGDEKSNIEAIHSRHVRHTSCFSVLLVARCHLPLLFDAVRLIWEQFKDPEQLRGKRVLVIGGGNSGCDIAVAAAEYAASSAIRCVDLYGVCLRRRDDGGGIMAAG